MQICSVLRIKQTFAIILLMLLTSLSLASNIEKSPNDKRLYATMTLDNQLDVLLISDATTDKAAVSLDLGFGSGSNPERRAGLAHFLEHMLFLGTEKYPDAGEYQAFIQSHGGSHNAFTALQNTNYFFDINAADLEPALDRFSQFFIAPLFSSEYADRERNAVHSEYTSKQKDDGRRIYAATQQAMNPQHPASRFAVGNLETLPTDQSEGLRKDLLDFYEQHYSANRMKLVILGQQNIDELKLLAQRYFSAIQNKNIPAATIDVPQFDKTKLPMQINVKTIQDTRSLSLSFPTPATQAHWRTKPLYLLSSLVGYEGEGSLLALLKEKGWATGLGASPGEEFTNENSFNVYISLTPAGFEHINDIVELFFSYANTLKKQGISASIYAEEQLLNQQAFQFLAEQAPIHYVTTLAQRMHDYPAQHWLDAPYILDTYNADLIQTFLNALRPDNLILSLQAQDVKTDSTEYYYQTAYSIQPISEKQLEKWRNPTPTPALFVRKNNPFIASDLSLVNDSQINPLHPIQLTTDQAGVKLWFKPDSTFKVPKADLYFTLLSPAARTDTASMVGLYLYSEMISDQLNKVLYDASMAGLNARIYTHQRGISVKLSGYNDKLPILASTIADALRHPEANQQRFKRILTEYREQLANNHSDKPYNQLYRVAYEKLIKTPTLEETEQAADGYEMEQMLNAAESLFASAELRILIHGNMHIDTAKDVAAAISTNLQPATLGDYAPSIDVLALNSTKARNHAIKIAHPDSGVLKYMQAKDESLQSQAAVTLLSEIISAPFYDQLRTEQQLGYIVFASPLVIRKNVGIALVVQSPSAKTETIIDSMDQFLAHFSDTLSSMPADQLEKFKRSVLARINEQDRQLSDRTSRYWQEIDLEELNFDTRESLSTAIEQLEISQLKDTLAELTTRTMTIKNEGKK